MAMAPKRTAPATAPEPIVQQIVISAPRFRTVALRITGTAPYMQARFSAKAMQAMGEKMTAGDEPSIDGAGAAKTRKPRRKPRDFDDDFRQAMHVSTEGWVGIPASAFRNACIDVCRMVGFKMTFAKMSIFVEPDGLDIVDGIPLVKLDAKPPEKHTLAVRNATGVADLRVRPLWRTWAATVRLRYDEDQFTLTDVANLLARAGMQVGVGEGRPFSRESNGLGFGLFSVVPGEVTA